MQGLLVLDPGTGCPKDVNELTSSTKWELGVSTLLPAATVWYTQAALFRWGVSARPMDVRQGGRPDVLGAFDRAWTGPALLHCPGHYEPTASPQEYLNFLTPESGQVPWTCACLASISAGHNHTTGTVVSFCLFSRSSALPPKGNLRRTGICWFTVIRR